MLIETSDAGLVEPSASVSTLIKEYDGLKWHDSLLSGDEFVFVQMDHDPDVAPVATLPSITHADDIYFVTPADIKLPDQWKERTSPYLAKDAGCEGKAFIPEMAADLIDASNIDNATIIEAIRNHRDEVRSAQYTRKNRELLEREREPYAGLYASVTRIDEETPMLIDGLMRDRGVSVIFGDFDEFKTTLVLDMMGHVAMGAPWQGREVKARPVILYALEGAEEISGRLRVLEASLKGQVTLWGNDRAPVTVRDRIPENYREWRAEICQIANRWGEVLWARRELNDIETRMTNDGELEPVYPECVEPVVVIDTLSMALGGDDERGPKAVGFINDCLDLLKERNDMCSPYDRKTEEVEAKEWWRLHDGIEYPVASHVIIIHHQTKTGIDFAGHRAIAANTQALYRVHRFGKIADAARPYAGQLTPQRVKGIPRPAPIRFEVDVVPVEGTKQTAVILKDKATVVPKELKPIIEALRELENPEAITPTDLNECLDVVAGKGKKEGSAKRKARERSRKKLEAAGVIEPVEDDNGKVAFYRFHDVVGV